ncbi:uncharacterized protein LOC136096658 [Hydra vulgaris]|uniref:uncharacterized protein LOC136096658 n=1 Tax=Hydra vulgaris TaxID=6087 RepID=UPI0032EA254D
MECDKIADVDAKFPDNVGMCKIDGFLRNYLCFKGVASCQHMESDFSTSEELKENDNETWGESETKVIKLFEQTLGVKNVKVEREHLLGSKDAKKPHIIMIKLLNNKDKFLLHELKHDLSCGDLVLTIRLETLKSNFHISYYKIKDSFKNKTANLFVDWDNHFISFAKPTKDEPVLLVLDNHESHINLDCYLLCRGNGIVLLSLPPHTSHRMQPLDLTYFGPLRSEYNRECDIFMAANIGRRITQYVVVELFTKAFNRLSNIEKVANGFRAAGIYPLNPTKFNDLFPITIITPETSLLDNIQSSKFLVNTINQSDNQAKSSEVLVNLSLNPSSVGLSPDMNVAPELVSIRSNQPISLLNIVSVPNLPKRKPEKI